MRGRLAQSRLVRLALGALALTAAGSVWACGFENPSSVAAQRGMMNLAFPKSAWVRTAIWQAQMTGELPRSALPQRDELALQASATLQLMRATFLLHALAARLGTQPSPADPPAMSVVLMGPMLWSRLEPQPGGAMLARVHLAGPDAGDVVMVTDTPALEAIAVAGKGFEHALALGLVRLYGTEAKVAAAQAWLSGAP